MKKPICPSKPVADVLRILATQLEAARREQRMPQAELAERAGISINTLKAILSGSPTVAVGTVFEVAYILGVPLAEDEQNLAVARNTLARLVKWMPKAVHKPGARIDDDF